jgi:NADPH2:quinone reductase
MRVVEVTAFGGPEVLRVAERPDPEPAAGVVVVAIHATSVNPTDLSTRDGSRRKRMPDLEPPFVPGWDLAGEILATGDRVVGMIPFGEIGGRVGAYAEQAAGDPAWLAPLPEGVPFEEAATLPLNALTARQSLDLLGLSAGDALLVTGASGGVGGFAVQMAVADGLRVIAVAGTGDEDWVESLGASEVLPRDADLSGTSPVDGVLDAVPLGPERSTPTLRDGGTAVFTRPPDPPEPSRDLRLETIMVKPDQEALTGLAEQLAAGRLRTRVARVLPLEEAAEAHRLVEAGGLRGKVVLSTRPASGR